MRNDPSVIKVRGLPYESTAREICSFFRDCEIIGGASGIFFTLNQRGLPTGEAFIEMETQSDIDSALRHNKERMGSRYIEVFESRLSVMEKVRSAQRGVRPAREDSRDRGSRGNFNRAPGGDRERGFAAIERERDNARLNDRGFSGGNDRGFGGGRGGRNSCDFACRLRGLPWSASKRDIMDFLHRVNVVGGEDGIIVTLNDRGQPSGDAYIELESQDDLDAALRCHRRDLGNRYVEVFEASGNEVERARDDLNSGRGGRGGGGGGFGGGRNNDGGGFGGGRNDGGGRNNDRNDGGRNNDGGGLRGSSRNTKGYVVQLRGLPYKVTEREIADWLAESAEPTDVVIIMDRRQRPSGEADASFSSRKDAQKVVQQMHRRDMGHRYVECFFEDSE